MNNYDFLINRLDAFIRKFYFNKLLKGLLVFAAATLAFYLLISVGEYYFYFSSTVRYVLLGSFLALGVFSLITFILFPLLQMQKLGKVISHHQAAEIIGNHFPIVKDKLLNVLQLKNQLADFQSKDLITASIEQKTKELSPIPFQTAINLNKNKKYLPLLLPSLLVGIFILFAAPNIFKDSAERLLQPSKSFAPKAPFTFELLNKKLAIPQFEDVELEVKINGKTIPDRVALMLNGQEIEMVKKSENIFAQKIFKVAKDVNFQFAAGGFFSQEYQLTVQPIPSLKNFKVFINYPAYTKKKNEVLDNIGDIVVPQGTTVSWELKTEGTEEVLFALGQNYFKSLAGTNNIFRHALRFNSDTSYSFILKNKFVQSKDTLTYRISTIPDQFPSINVQEYNDSLTQNFVLFVGEAGDDYGISLLALHYSIQGKNQTRNGKKPLSFQGSTSIQFNHFLDIEELNLLPGDKLTYYFLVCDNDQVHGGKCSKSALFSFDEPTTQKVDSMISQTQNQINKELKDANKENEKLDKDLKKMKENLLNKENLDWKDKMNIEKLSDRNENIQKQIENVKQKFQQNNERSESKEYSEQIKDKQESVENLLEELKNNKLEERMKKLEELMKLMNKDQLFDQLNKLQDENMQMEKDLDRMLELMKQLEMEMRLEDLAKKAEALAEKQEKLAKENEAGTKTNEQIKKEQDELNKEMDALKKEMEELEKVNESAENKKELDDAKKDQEEAENEMDNAGNEMSKGQKSKASKSQKNAAKKLKEMAEKLKQQSEGGGEKDQTEIDIKATRQLLQNLIRLSFDQEKLISDVQKTPTSNPSYINLIQKQNKLKNDNKMIADSLFALSKRVFQISTYVNKESIEINRNMENAINTLEARIPTSAMVSQQYVMTGVNNLALMLNELLEKLQKEQAEQQGESKGGQCDKPGSKPGKKPGKGKGKGKGQGVGMQLSDIISKQQQLGGAMEKLMQQMKDGKSPGEKGKNGEKGKDGKGEKPGKDGKDGKEGENGEGEKAGGDSEQMARIAAQQGALRKQLNDIQEQLKKEGKSNPQISEIQKEMDRNETDIVNRRITNDLIKRQSEILTRLLKAKDALREQEQGEEREAQQGKEVSREIPQSLKDILKSKQSAVDYYKTVPAELKPYYKKLVEEYFGIIK